MERQQISIVVGSRNPVKINATQQAFSDHFPECDIICKGIDAPSGVAAQPMTEAETLLGAQNRVAFCQANAAADYYVAIEGGVEHFSYGVAAFAFVVITNHQQSSVGRSSNLPLPQTVYHQLDTGIELGSVMDKLFNTNNIKQKGGAMALLTNNRETRQSTYTQALTLAMAPFLHRQLFNQ
ncbi:inosine/xanthosine triphosphatase [Flocculibacter collagenilyticus]|uniref:inosine/xanthosine triphosphatase n=1 Tax=Flocculibacter collagenilyticus TaxID=2744479 RepID=UPI0018F75412|nr:inosine/xanthosine triphosphatase [Flocculibacter collagenilyticus]